MVWWYIFMTVGEGSISHSPSTLLVERRQVNHWEGGAWPGPGWEGSWGKASGTAVKKPGKLRGSGHTKGSLSSHLASVFLTFGLWGPVLFILICLRWGAILKFTFKYTVMATESIVCIWMWLLVTWKADIGRAGVSICFWLILPDLLEAWFSYLMYIWTLHFSKLA